MKKWGSAKALKEARNCFTTKDTKGLNGPLMAQLQQPWTCFSVRFNYTAGYGP